ncbi:glycoside hydrolase family 92 protein [Pseudonocardiaceae bacterium YIM PH 21723]|nr:glycoside hydrolase family 92 protein [Pseudonocardiaceae bacterium YIM PH 21723]
MARSARASWLGVVTALCVTAGLVTPASAEPRFSTADPIGLVNTFIGTKDDGNTFPGAAMPFGKAQVSPIGDHYAGWRYDDPKIRGFGHHFLSGAGCFEQGGLVSVLPTTGTVGPGGTFDTKNPQTFDHARYGSAYTHEGEVGRPGYYRTRLTDYGGIDAETTATTRTGVERYTFTDPAKANVFVNVGQAASKHPVYGSEVKLIGDRTIEGWVDSLAFCGGKSYRTWFTTTFDRPFKDFGTWDPNGGTPGSKETSGRAGLRGAWLGFAGEKTVTATTATSTVDAEGARKNLAAEKAAGFDATRTQAEQAWRDELTSVRIAGGQQNDLVVFYTSLYHVLLQPLTGNDVDGRYRGFDDKIHTADGWTYYEYFSLWDTYRTQNQLLAMLRPDRAKDIARSVLAINEQGGWLPRWAYANQETNTMTGDPVTPFLVDLWKFGALEGREGEALTALLKNANGLPPKSSPFEGRAGNPNYLAKGFIEYDKNHPKKGQDVDQHYGGSATLEYALADCSLSIMAGELGAADQAALLKKRGRNWQNLWDASVTDRDFQGFLRPKVLDGSWYTPAGKPYSPASADGFHEGTAWQYQWLVQQDSAALAEKMGGQANAAKRLDEFFAYDKVLADPAGAVRKEWVLGPYDYYDQRRYNPNNEPDLHSPWMYGLLGQPWKTSTIAHAAQTLFTNEPKGVTGNDDLGTMSAWYVFSALGMYPVMPGTGHLVLNAPRFAKVALRLGGGQELVIEAPGADPAGPQQYIAGVKVGQTPNDKVYLDWSALKNGGTVSYDLTTTPPTKGWGTSPEAAPKPPCAA